MADPKEPKPQLSEEEKHDRTMLALTALTTLAALVIAAAVCVLTLVVLFS